MKILFEQLIQQYDQLKYALLQAQTFDENHFGFSPLYYQIMESDQQRIGAFQQAFELHNHLQDGVVCEVGVGTLALTKLYMPYVKKAYWIESNPELIPFLEAAIQENAWEDKVEVYYKNALEVSLPEPVDFLVGELMSIYCANEFQVQIFQHMRQFLKPQGQLFPNRIINFARLCAAQFEGGRKHYPINFSRHRPMFLSQQVLVNEIHLAQEEEQGMEVSLTIPVQLSGCINALYLESYVEVTPGANFTGTDSLMPPTVLQVEEPLVVKAGDLVPLTLRVEYGTSLEEVSCRLG